MDNKRAIEVLQAMIKGSTGYTAVEREDALDLAAAVLASHELMSTQRWWATYNAALTGLCAQEKYASYEDPCDVRHVIALAAANMAHGKLVQP